MADTPQTLALVTLAQQYRGDIVRQINRRVVLLKLLPIVNGAGKNVAWVAQSSGQLAENFTDGADASNFGSDAQASAILSWGLYRSNMHVTDLAMSAAASSGTPLGNLMLWARNIVDSSAALAAAVEAAAFSGAGTGTLVAGLDVAIGSTSNTYASIDRSSSSYWRPYVVDPGSATVLTLAQIRTDIAGIYTQCGENPDIAICPPAVFNKVVGLFDPTRRNVDIVNTARGTIRLDAGYTTVEVDGVVFVKSKDATAATIYYVNSNYAHFEVLPPAGLPEEITAMVDASDGFGKVLLGMAYKKLAVNGASERAQISSQIQLVVKRPNACGVRLNVSTA